jgi:Flp pilus assembly protein TadG
LTGRRKRAAVMHNRGDKGLAAVEFALVLPALVTLLFGIIVTGTVFLGRMQVQAAAREGARAGAVAPGQACSSARSQLASFNASSVTCTETRDCAATGSSVKLHVAETVSVPVLGTRTVSLDSTSVYACQS